MALFLISCVVIAAVWFISWEYVEVRSNNKEKIDEKIQKGIANDTLIYGSQYHILEGSKEFLVVYGKSTLSSVFISVAKYNKKTGSRDEIKVSILPIKLDKKTKKKPKKKKYIYKSAVTGKIVSKAYADKNPKKTFRQKV